MMTQFRPVELQDRDWINSLLSYGPRETLEYNFTTIFLWRSIYHFKAARMGDFVVILSDSARPSFLYPCGKGEVRPVLEAILELCRREGRPAVFHSVSPRAKAELEALYPGQFEFVPARDSADYIYDAESLRSLKGKKLSAKRNHINRFVEAHPEWQYEPLTRENLEEAYQMNLKWCSMVDCQSEPGLRDEACAVRQAFRHFFDLRLDGGLLRTRDGVVAFSMGDRLNEQTYLVHIEKAFASVQGAYPMINQQFVLHNCKGYQYVDREDDAGDEGLRKAKLSYRPAVLAEKYLAKYIAE